MITSNMSSEPFISNDLFILYSDIVLVEIIIEPELTNIISYGLLQPKNKTPVIFVKVELLEYYIPVLKRLVFPFILITTGSDDPCLPYYYFPPKNENIKQNHDELLETPNLVRWITKNPSIEHPKLAPLPMGPKWQYTSHAFFGEDKAPILKVLHDHCREPQAFFENPVAKPHLLYFSFGQTTGHTFYEPHTRIREQVLDILSSRFPQNTAKPFAEYLAEMKTHKFAVAPPGRGLDTHRAWESLMVGTIPIMMTTPLNSLYDNLPVLIIEDWAIITPEFLEKEYIRIRARTYDFSVLYSPYWKNLLENMT